LSRLQVARPPAAARAGAAGRQHAANGQQLWSEVQQLAQQARTLEQQGSTDEAAELLEEGECASGWVAGQLSGRLIGG
jgi:hypothetical protein